MQKECDQKQRFSLRKLSVGLASVLVSVSFMAVSASQTVHANELQTPSQSDSAVQKADNDVATDNDQSNNTAHVVNHVDPNSNLQQNDNKRTANVATDSNENTVWGGDGVLLLKMLQISYRKM